MLPFILSFFSFLYAEEKYCLYYGGDLSEIKDSSIKVPDEAVALCRTIHVDRPDTYPYIWNAPSIFFIIDHSGSMCYDNLSDPDFPKDQWGQRFTTSLELIDSIRARFPGTEVGITAFRQHLYFNPADSSFFKQHPSYPMGAYIPFFKLDSAYNSHGGDPGYFVVRNILHTDTVLADNDPLANASPGYQYLSLKYWPTNYQQNSTGTNINAGFDAAKHAFESSLYSKDRQFIIFLSGSEANVANGPHTNPNDFEAGESVPTTFTLFFTKQSSVPQSIQTMTKNIQESGWSINNCKSKVWSIDPNNQDLIQLIIDSITIKISSDYTIFKPNYISINGIEESDFDSINNLFSFNDHFSFTGVKTDFYYLIDYSVSIDSILPNGDTIIIISCTTSVGDFSIVADPSITEPPNWYPNDFEMIRWNRSLGFYYKNAQVASINMGMDTLEVRFIEERVDILYGYDSVSVTITNTKGNIDSETFELSKTDTCFTKLFTLALDSTPTQNDGILQLFDRDTVTAVFRNSKLPLDTLELSVPFYPTTAINPNSYFNQSVLSLNIINSSILFNLPSSGNTKLQIYDMKGRLLTTLVDSYKRAGIYKINRNRKGYGTGIYYVLLSTGENILVRKAIILK